MIANLVNQMGECLNQQKKKEEEAQIKWISQ